MPVNEYKPGSAFPGVIGRTADVSSPAWPEPMRAVPGAPNVLLVVLDDTGYGQFGCYGSPIRTPRLDAPASGGLLYNNMHTTALCSPSRSCIITGRNHHSNGMAAVTEMSTGYPGYNGNIPFKNGFFPGRRRRRRPDEPGHERRRLGALPQGRQAALHPQLRPPGPVHRLRHGPGTEGRHELRFEFEPTGEPDLAAGKGTPGHAELFVDRQRVGSADFPQTTPIMFNPGGVTCGADPGPPVTPEYASPFRFTGTLHSVTVDVSGELIIDAESEMRMHLARQ